MCSIPCPGSALSLSSLGPQHGSTRPADTDGVLDAIEAELARAEAIDRDLFVISPHTAGVGSAPSGWKRCGIRSGPIAYWPLPELQVRGVSGSCCRCSMLPAEQSCASKISYTLSKNLPRCLLRLRVAARLLNVHFDSNRNEQPQAGTD